MLSFRHRCGVLIFTRTDAYTLLACLGVLSHSHTHFLILFASTHILCAHRIAYTHLVRTSSPCAHLYVARRSDQAKNNPKTKKKKTYLLSLTGADTNHYTTEDSTSPTMARADIVSSFHSDFLRPGIEPGSRTAC